MPVRYEHTGNAIPTTLSSSITSGDLSITLVASTGWPTGAVGKFWLVINRGQATEEKVLATSRSGAVITVTSGDRGADGTSAQAHTAGETVEHSWSATEADDASAHIMASTDRHGVGAASAVVGTATTQTLTNKTISGANNILSAIPQSAVTSLVSDQATQDSRLTAIEGVNTTQNTNITALQSADTALQAEDVALDARLDILEAAPAYIRIKNPTTDASFGAGVYTTMTWSEEHRKGDSSAFTVNASNVQVNHAGVYRVTANVTMTGARPEVKLVVGARILAREAGHSDDGIVSITAEVWLAANSQIALAIFNFSGTGTIPADADASPNAFTVSRLFKAA